MFMGVKTLHQLYSKKHHDTSNNVLNSIIVNDTFAPMRRGWICRLQKIQRPSNLHTTYLSRYSRYGMVWFYIALYPVRWTAQSALHFPPLADLFIPTPFSASLGSILAMQQLRNDYSLTFPPLSIARYSFIQLSRLRRREVKENAQTSKR